MQVNNCEFFEEIQNNCEEKCENVTMELDIYPANCRAMLEEYLRAANMGNSQFYQMLKEKLVIIRYKFINCELLERADIDAIRDELTEYIEQKIYPAIEAENAQSAAFVRDNTSMIFMKRLRKYCEQPNTRRMHYILPEPTFNPQEEASEEVQDPEDCQDYINTIKETFINGVYSVLIIQERAEAAERGEELPQEPEEPDMLYKTQKVMRYMV